MDTYFWIGAAFAGMYVASYAAESWVRQRQIKRNIRIATDLETRAGLDAMRRIERKGRR